MALNRLATETSPYLRQHQANPVDWFPWGEEALSRAKADNKPILLSVGYAACHWCHVMAHESFESPDIAAVMNDHFINIKVDREERPDLDNLYQTALALLGQQGGWPLTMFLTPDGAPFWGGTYFPPDSRFGRPGFRQVLERIAELYRDDPDAITDNKTRLSAALNQLYAVEPDSQMLAPALLDTAAQEVLSQVDWHNGGLKGAPKFPQPYLLDLLWRAHHRGESDTCREAVILALERMSQGGIYDHLGGGYARYSVDERWLVPHFEKMLYDNGQILSLLLTAWRATGQPLFQARIEETVGWLLREMRTADGAFAASLDADSEGEEGKYYVWDAAEIDRLLGDASALFKKIYDVRPAGNWEGKTILNRLSSSDGVTSDAEEKALAEMQETLLRQRDSRVAPARDDKILADWNGLVIAPLAEAGLVLHRPDWIEAAETAFAFIQEQMSASEGGLRRLYHSLCDGRRQDAAMLEDHANMAFAALTLYEITGKSAYLGAARDWVDAAESLFADPRSGAYFQSPKDAKDVFIRPISGHDHAIPGGNGMMVQVLAKLYHLTYEERYRERAEAVLKAFRQSMSHQPIAFASLLNGFDDLLHAPEITVIAPATDIPAWRDAIFSLPLPGRACQTFEEETALPAGHPAKEKAAQGPGAYLCRDGTCQPVIPSPEDLAAALRS